MPRPKSERQAWEEELKNELPALIEFAQRELDATPIEFTEGREQLEWQIQRARKRMAEVEARLAGG